MTVTPVAVAAARKAISCTCDGSLPHDVSCDKDISDAGLSAALEAAAPHILKAERNRMVLAVRHTCACDPCKSAVVDLIGGYHRQANVPGDPQ